MPGPQLQAAAVQSAQLMDALTAEFAADLQPVLALLNAKLRTLIRRIQTDPTGRLVATRTSLALALRLKTDIAKALVQAGYVELAATAVNDPLDRLAASVLDGQALDAATLGAYDVDALAALKQLRLADLVQVGEQAAATVWRAVVDGVLGARPVLDLVDTIADALDLSAKQARTIYDTGVSTYSRQVGQLGTTGEDDEPFLYAGPNDQKTREFCADRVGKVYSRGRIDDMDNGQLDPVMAYGGGYNCRHTWMRVSPLDKELLAIVDQDVTYASFAARELEPA